MSVKKDTKKVTITPDIDTYIQICNIAINEGRSVNRQILIILKSFLDEKNKSWLSSYQSKIGDNNAKSILTSVLQQNCIKTIALVHNPCISMITTVLQMMMMIEIFISEKSVFD